MNTHTTHARRDARVRRVAAVIMAAAWALSMAAGIAGMVPDTAPACDMSTQPAGATFCPGAVLDVTQVVAR